MLVTNQRNFTKGRGLERVKYLLGEGLLTSEGEFHLRQRRLAQPAFHKQRIASYGAIMTHYTEDVHGNIGMPMGTSRDVHDEMMRLTLLIVAKAASSTKISNTKHKK